MTLVGILLIVTFIYGRKKIRDLYKFVFLLSVIILFGIPTFILLGSLSAADDLASVFVVLLTMLIIEGVQSIYGKET